MNEWTLSSSYFPWGMKMKKMKASNNPVDESWRQPIHTRTELWVGATCAAAQMLFWWQTSTGCWSAALHGSGLTLVIHICLNIVTWTAQAVETVYIKDGYIYYFSCHIFMEPHIFFVQYISEHIHIYTYTYNNNNLQLYINPCHSVHNDWNSELGNLFFAM